MRFKAKLKINTAAVTAILLCALLGLAAAQESKENVAFYFSGKEPKVGIYKPLSGFITMAIVNSGEYIAVDRTQYVLDHIAKEQTYQRTGAVDDGQISELGKQWGVKYVVSIEASKSIDGYYLEAKMVDVEKAHVAKMGAATSKLANDKELQAAADKIIELLGMGGKVSTDGGSYFTDSRDGQKYRKVKIGYQTWMAENMNYKTGQSWCYDNNESNCKKYGRLYDWNTAKGACPKGWHLPDKDEWNRLMVTVGGVKKTLTHEGKTYHYHDFAGKLLKSTTAWNNNGNGTDAFGFSALPGGFRNTDGSFNLVGYYGYWWSATESGGGEAYNRDMLYDGGSVGEGTDVVRNGFSARCVED